MKDIFNPEGRLEIRLYDKNRKLLNKWNIHNQITTAGKELMFNRSFGSLFKCGSDMFGQVYSRDTLMGKYNNFNYHADNTAITFGLLKLGDKRNGLKADSSFVPIYSSDFTNLDKVVGIGSINIVDSGKEGHPIFSRGSTVAASYAREMAWEFPLNIAGGEFDTIVLTGYDILTNPAPTAQGMINFKCLDKVDVKASAFGSMSTGFCPPGFPGVTNDNEILLNFSYNGQNKWKYNLATGEMTALSDSDPFFIPITEKISDYYIEDNYLYTIECETQSSSTYRPTLYVYDITTQSRVTSQALTLGNLNYLVNAMFLKYNNNLYITFAGNEQSSANGARALLLTKGSSGYYEMSKTSGSIADVIGINLPSGLNAKMLGIGKYNNDYLICYGTMGITCTDPNNIADTMTGIIPYLNNKMVAIGSGTNAGFLSVGVPESINTSATAANTVNGYDAAWYKGGTNSSSLINQGITAGVYFMREGHYAIMTSYVALSKPITKSDDHIMTLGYMYSFGDDSETVQV